MKKNKVKKKYKLIVYKKGTIFSNSLFGLIIAALRKNYTVKYEDKSRRTRK